MPRYPLTPLKRTQSKVGGSLLYGVVLCRPFQHSSSSSEMTTLRRNPRRKCRTDPEPANSSSTRGFGTDTIDDGIQQSIVPPKVIPTKRAASNQTTPDSSQAFRFCDLPRELRDNVYSHLLINYERGTPMFEAKPLLKGQKKRDAAKRTRERLNTKRSQAGQPPVQPRKRNVPALVDIDIMFVSKQLLEEAKDFMYKNNHFAVSVDSYTFSMESIPFDIPFGWDLTRITKMQFELQLKDGQRMNRQIDWAQFFSWLPALASVRIIPTFHPRYYEWAQCELQDWESAHAAFRTFFRELVVSIPKDVSLKLGPSLDHTNDMRLQGKEVIPRQFLWQMYREYGMLREVDNGSREGSASSTSSVIDRTPEHE